MCGRAISRTRKYPRNIPPPDEGRRVFVLLARAMAKQAPRRAYLHANLGGTDDWAIKFTGTEGHTPELCRLLNELQGEMERGGTGRDASNSPRLQKAATN